MSAVAVKPLWSWLEPAPSQRPRRLRSVARSRIHAINPWAPSPRKRGHAIKRLRAINPWARPSRPSVAPKTAARSSERAMVYSWPDSLPTRLACLYCSTSRRTLLRAVNSGDLSPVGKRGRTLVFDRADLDAWMRAEPAELEAVPPPRTYRKGGDPSVDAALAKLRGLAH